MINPIARISSSCWFFFPLFRELHDQPTRIVGRDDIPFLNTKWCGEGFPYIDGFDQNISVRHALNQPQFFDELRDAFYPVLLSAMVRINALPSASTSFD